MCVAVHTDREIFDNSLAVQRALQRGVNTPGNAATNLWNQCVESEEAFRLRRAAAASGSGQSIESFVQKKSREVFFL